MSIFNTGKSLIKGTKVVPVFYTINNDFTAYAACSIVSLIQHMDKKRYYRIIILHDGLSFKNYLRLRNLVCPHCEIQFRKMTHNIWLRTIIHYCSKRNGSGDFFSSAVYYYRSFIARLFPLYDKAVYIDSDTILLRDVAELYDQDLEGHAVMALVDPKVENVIEFRDYVEHAVGVPYTEYVNSGVMLLNLKKLRKMRYLTQLIEMINQFDADLVAPDQDYLNVICRGDIKKMNTKWNLQPSDYLPADASLLHFNLFKKPWFYDNVEGEEYFWEAAKRSGFYNDLIVGKQNFTQNDKRLNEAKIEALIKKAGKLAKSESPLIKKIEL